MAWTRSTATGINFGTNTSRPDPNLADSQVCQQAKAADIVHAQKGSRWLTDDTRWGGGYTHVNPPNTKACFYLNDAGNPAQGNVQFSMVGASSFHPGGVNCLMMDGSVKFIKNSVAYAAWKAIATHERWRGRLQRRLLSRGRPPPHAGANRTTRTFPFADPWGPRRGFLRPELRYPPSEPRRLAHRLLLSEPKSTVSGCEST